MNQWWLVYRRIYASLGLNELKIRKFATLERCENWLGLVNCCVYYARYILEIYQVQLYSVDFKAPGELWNPPSKTLLSKCYFIWNKRPATSQMIVNSKVTCTTDLYVFFSIFLTLWRKSFADRGGSLHNCPVMQSFDISFAVILVNLLSNQSSCCWFHTPWLSYHCNGIPTFICNLQIYI